MAEREVLQNDLLLRACRGEEVERVPVWIMRQAGRYLPEFIKRREHCDFFEMCQTPKLAAEITLLPLERYPLDAAIIFSDILVVPQVMGLKISLEPGEGPVIANPIRDPVDLSSDKLNLSPSIDALAYVGEAIKLTKKLLNGRVPLIGFAGAPWTIMAYMIEGKSSKEWTLAKQWLYKYPDASHTLLGVIANITTQYLIMQAKAGANVLQVFDSWVGVISPSQFTTFILPYLNQMATNIKKELGESFPLIIFAKGGHYALHALAQSKYDVISLDWTMDPIQARQICVGKTLQGNLDPCALYGDEQSIKKEVQVMLDAFGTRGYIANLGHGLHPTHKPENVGWFIKYVQQLSKKN